MVSAIHPLARSLAICLYCAAGVAAQTRLIRPAPPAASRPLGEPRVPIHSHPDDPVFGPYGTWAAGPDYKVSFHDGFTFYPLLGPSYPANLPFAWRTESVRVGERSLLRDAEQPRHVAFAWRHEYRYQEVVEAYDVRADGVEQTFVLGEPPAAAGDWVVTGRIVTSLQATHVAAAHAGLVFRDAAQVPLVRYGEAFAVDAAGDVARAETSFDGERIRLRVDGAWLARARFPVVLDPLTTRVAINTSSTGGVVRETDVGHDGNTTGSPHAVMVAYTRVHAANDLDVYADVTNPDFTTYTGVFADVSAGTNTEKAAVAFVGAGANRWAVAFQRTDQSNLVSRIRLYAHNKGSNSTGGTLMFMNQSSPGATERNPDAGGAGGGPHAFVVFQTDLTNNNTNTPNTEVHGVMVNLANHTWGTPFRLANVAAGTTYDRENPAVNQAGPPGPSGSWMTVWQELNRNVADNWDIVGQRIANTGHRAAQATLTSQMPLTEQKIVPKVDGTAERYMVTYLVTDAATGTFGKELRVRRFDAAESASSLNLLQTRTIAGPVAFSQFFYDPEISYDHLTDSHWAIAYEYKANLGPILSAHVVRVGHTGGVVERATMHSGTVLGETDPAVTCHPFFAGPTPASRFLVVHAAPGPSNPVWGQALLYDPAALNVAVGSGCGGNISARTPNAGDEFFGVRLSTGAAISTSAILLLSNAQGNTSLAGVGMPGCFLNVSASFFLAFPVPVNSGFVSLQLSLPDAPVFVGNIYCQWIYLSPGANAANLLATQGLLSAVR